MPVIFNYFYFFIFLYLLGKGYTRASSKMTYLELGEKKDIIVNRGEYMIYFLLVTSLFAFYSPGLLDLAAIRLLLTLGIFIFMLMFLGQGVRFTAAIYFYLLFIVWVLLGFAYTSYPAYSLRVLLKYLYPLLLFFVTSTFIQREDLVVKISQDLRKVALFSLGVYLIPYVSFLFTGVFYYGTAIAIHYIAISAIYLASFLYLGRRRKDMLLALLFVLPCIIWSFRTSLLANVVFLSVFSVFLYKLRAVIIIAIIAIMGVCVVFYIPSVKEKMFFNSQEITIQDFQEGNISMDNINSSGRFAMWEDLVARFYSDNKIIGSGTGTVQGYMYNNHVFNGVRVPHNEYLPIICDNGLIGLVLYVSALLLIIIHCYIEFIKKHNGHIIRFCAVVSASSLSGVLCSMYTENAILYSVATFTCPIAFYGMMMGLKWAQKSDKFDKYA
ncbi:MAG: O-antigen ligase family protein [bacterium]